MPEREIPSPRLTVDAVVIANRKVLLVRRGRPPFLGHWALPGGFVEVGETVEEAARREVKEETGLAVALTGLVNVYSDPTRDPRFHTVSVVFRARPAQAADPKAVHAGDDAEEARWFPLDAVPALAFDHDQILRDALTE